MRETHHKLPVMVRSTHATKNMPKKLTVLIPCRNESHNIRACVESVRPVADEILVADSLSTDDTTDIVRRLGDCRLIGREFVDHADFQKLGHPASVARVDSANRRRRAAHTAVWPMKFATYSPTTIRIVTDMPFGSTTIFSAVRSAIAAGTARR